MTHYFVVRAYTKAGESENSPQASAAAGWIRNIRRIVGNPRRLAGVVALSGGIGAASGAAVTGGTTRGVLQGALSGALIALLVHELPVSVNPPGVFDGERPVVPEDRLRAAPGHRGFAPIG